AMLYKFRRERFLPEFPIYIGGLSSKMTDIYDRRAHVTRRQLPRLQLMRDAAPFILNDETVRDAPLRAGRIYALSSGMMIPKTLSPRKIVLVHGDPPAVEWMRVKLNADLPGADVIVPTPGVEVEL